MQNAMTATTTATASVSGAGAQIERRQMPLSFLKAGEQARIVKVRGKGDVHHHLENLGFVEGTVVKVVSEISGNMIVQVMDSQVALNRQVASRVITAG